MNCLHLLIQVAWSYFFTFTLMVFGTAPAVPGRIGPAATPYLEVVELFVNSN